MPDPASRLSARAQRAGGQPIGELMHRALAQPELISLAAGFVDQATLPIDETQRAFERLWSEPSAARASLQYGTTAGVPRLREQLLERLAASEGDAAGYRARGLDQVLITSGSNQLLFFLADTLCEPGDIVLCAAPTYFVFLGVLRQLGIRALSVAADAAGLVPEALDQTLAELDARGQLDRVKALYLCSYFDNPSGITLAPERRQPVVECLQKWSRQGVIYLIEDIAYRQLRFSGGDVPTLWAHDPLGETVILTDTFSKCFSPGIRLGYAVLPRALVGPMHDLKGNFDFGAPHLNQALLSQVLDRGWLAPHVERLRAAYRAKRDAMLEACHAHLAGIDQLSWITPAGGLYVWLTLPPRVDAGLDGPLFPRALDSGVIYVPGGYCYPPEGSAPVAANTIRLSYGVQPAERIALGIEKLGRAIRRVLGD